jgi:hypothetical protein
VGNAGAHTSPRGAPFVAEIHCAVSGRAVWPVVVTKWCFGACELLGRYWSWHVRSGPHFRRWASIESVLHRYIASALQTHFLYNCLQSALPRPVDHLYVLLTVQKSRADHGATVSRVSSCLHQRPPRAPRGWPGLKRGQDSLMGKKSQ